MCAYPSTGRWKTELNDRPSLDKELRVIPANELPSLEAVVVWFSCYGRIRCEVYFQPQLATIHTSWSRSQQQQWSPGNYYLLILPGKHFLLIEGKLTTDEIKIFGSNTHPLHRFNSWSATGAAHTTADHRIPNHHHHTDIGIGQSVPRLFRWSFWPLWLLQFW